MLVKIMSNSLDIDSERNLKNKCTTDNLFKLQNQKLDEYIEFINNPYYSKSFPKYYSKSIINIIFCCKIYFSYHFHCFRVFLLITFS